MRNAFAGENGGKYQENSEEFCAAIFVGGGNSDEMFFRRRSTRFFPLNLARKSISIQFSETLTTIVLTENDSI